MRPLHEEIGLERASTRRWMWGRGVWAELDQPEPMWWQARWGDWAAWITDAARAPPRPFSARWVRVNHSMIRLSATR